MPLKLDIGHYSESGPREANEDRFGIVTPSGADLACKGVLLAVADGVSGSLGGQEAAQYTVRGLMADYYATPDTWPVSRSLNQVLMAVNQWVASQARKRAELAGMACTLTALVLRGSRYHLAHAGDTRAYRLRGDSLEQLSIDHVWDRPDLRHVLTRAVGLEDHLVLDHAEGDMAVDDLFLVMTDGIWSVLDNEKIHSLCLLHQDCQLLAKALVQEALRAGGRDNATAVVARIREIPPASLEDLHGETKILPSAPALKPGQILDDFLIKSILHKGNMARLYLAQDLHRERTVVLKTPNPLRRDDPALHEGFLHEEWLGKRLLSEHVVEVLPIPPGRRSALYYVMSHHPGHTLAERLSKGQHFTVSQVVDIGRQLLKGLGALHRLDILHRDIKPDNLLLNGDGKLRILDLGAAASVRPHEQRGNPGTPSFMAPERFSGKAASPQSDIYAVGVTLYHLLIRRYPYGEIEPFQHPPFREPVPASRYRPDIPDWLDDTLRKACARQAAHRFETVEEFLLYLERGNAQPARLPSTPYLERDPVAFWRGLSLVLILIILLLLYLLSLGV